MPDFRNSFNWKIWDFKQSLLGKSVWKVSDLLWILGFHGVSNCFACPLHELNLSLTEKFLWARKRISFYIKNIFKTLTHVWHIPLFCTKIFCYKSYKNKWFEIHGSSLVRTDTEDNQVHTLSYLCCVFFLLSAFQATGKDKFPAGRNRKTTKNVSKAEATGDGPDPSSKHRAEAAQEQDQRSRKWNVGSVAFLVCGWQSHMLWLEHKISPGKWNLTLASRLHSVHKWMLWN